MGDLLPDASSRKGAPHECDDYRGRRPQVQRPGAPRRLGLVRAFAVQDWILAVYFTLLTLALLAADPHPARGATLAAHVALAAAVVASITAVRAGHAGRTPVPGLVYRVAAVCCLPMSYLQLRAILPIVNPDAYDATLRALDIALWGRDPVVWLDRFVTPATTEWFAFIYYGYFAFFGAFVLPLLVTRRSGLRHEAGLGVILIVTIGHLSYVAVPAWGPYHAFPEVFPTPLPPGPWLDTVRETVRAAGALKDIFPSLHTAMPVYAVLFTLRHRRVGPLGFLLPVAAFIAANLVVAAVFLRWHYVVDVLAGLALAGSAHVAAPRIARWEAKARARAGIEEVWPPLLRGRSFRAAAASDVMK